MKKKLFLLTIALLCTVVQGAWAKDQIKYIERSWDGSKVVETEKTITDYTLLEGDHSDDWMHTTGFYVVKGDVKYKTLNVYGDARIILLDDATLTCTGGILVDKNHDNAQLFIYSQSSGDSEGKLIVTNSYTGTAGIGVSYSNYNRGTFGENPELPIRTYCGKIHIHGGVLNVHGNKQAAGIGGGDNGDDMDINNTLELYMYGGTVYAEGGKEAAGIGGGRKLEGGKVWIYGGSLTAQGGKYGAGIGNGNSKAKNPSELRVYGGTVTATGGKYGAGIGGGGYSGCGGNVYIYAGTVNAYGGEDAAGIGGGECGDGGETHISGGVVRAVGKSYGAGIGGGECTSNWDNDITVGGKTYITGGIVTAIAGEDCNARKDKCGSAIGCGDGQINKDAAANLKVLEIAANMRVTGGDAEDDIERVFSTDERVGACIWRNYVKIEPCEHTTPDVGTDHNAAVSYTIDGDKHTRHCRYCAYTQQEAHQYTTDNICSVCLKTGDTDNDLWSVTLYRATAASSTGFDEQEVMKVVKGQSFTVPAVSATEGLMLMGYATSPVGLCIEMADGETLTAVGAVVTPEADMSLYPRYRYRYVPTWTWDDTNATATLSIVCSALSSQAVDVTNISYTTEGEVKTATGTYDHDGATYTFTDTYLLPVEEDILLRDNASNEETLDKYKGRKVKMLRLEGRTLYADGLWNTLCLPFSISAEDIYTNFGSCTLKTLESSSFANGVLTLNFEDATTIEAGMPYLIKWASTDSDRNSPMFNYVTIDDAYEAVTTTDYVDFVGSFSPVSLEANDKSVLYLGADNTLYYPSSDMTVGSCRALFQLKDIIAGYQPAGARSFVFNFGDGETATGIIGIGSTRTDTDKNDGYWYDLQGRKLSGKPTQKGIYINHGNKVVIK